MILFLIPIILANVNPIGLILWGVLLPKIPIFLPLNFGG